jgi:hypothetical protein
MLKRRRFRQSMTLQERLQLWAEKVRADAEQLRPGPEKTRSSRKRDRPTQLATWTTGRTRPDCSLRAESPSKRHSPSPPERAAL